MILTTFTFTCDVEGCSSEEETKEVLGLGIGGSPKGWAVLNWTMDAKPDEADPRLKFMKAVKKVNAKLPPDMAALQDAGTEMFIGEIGPRTVSCSALICDGCLNKINLADFRVNNGGSLLR
jgi:hypothetical protein